MNIATAVNGNRSTIVSFLKYSCTVFKDDRLSDLGTSNQIVFSLSDLRIYTTTLSEHEMDLVIITPHWN